MPKDLKRDVLFTIDKEIVIIDCNLVHYFPSQVLT